MKTDTELTSRVKEVLSKHFSTSPSKILLKTVTGGFTPIFKFKLSVNNSCYFLKVADEQTQKTEASLVESEGQIYSFLKDVGLTGKVYPSFESNLSKNGLKILVINYLNNTSWGGPWDVNSIELLDKTLTTLHGTNLSSAERKKLTKLTNSVRQKIKSGTKKTKQQKEDNFLKSWNTKEQAFMNADGEAYFRGGKGLVERILEVASHELNFEPRELIHRDMNYANIGLSKSKVYLVDPVYARLGIQDFDRTMAGVNILQQSSNINLNNKEIKLVKDKFITNRIILSWLIKSYVGTAYVKPNENNSAWQRYHQECAQVALELFVEGD